MENHIFTTRGWLPADQVELRETTTHDDEYLIITRVDKYVAGEWVGNDLEATVLLKLTDRVD